MLDVIGALSTAVTGAATIVLAIFTWLLWSESKKQRNLATSPDIGVYLEPDPMSYNSIYLVIRNIGQGPAYRLGFRVDPTDAGWNHHDGQSFPLRSIAMVRDGLEYLAPGQERRVFYGPYNELPKEAVTLTVTYDRKNVTAPQQGKDRKPEFTERFSLDPRQFEGLLYSTPIEREQLRATQSIGKSLKSMAKDVRNAARFRENGAGVSSPAADPPPLLGSEAWDFLDDPAPEPTRRAGRGWLGSVKRRLGIGSGDV